MKAPEGFRPEDFEKVNQMPLPADENRKERVRERNELITTETDKARDTFIKFFVLWTTLVGASLVALISFVQTLTNISAKNWFFATEFFLLLALFTSATSVFLLGQASYHNAKRYSSIPGNSENWFSIINTAYIFWRYTAIVSYIVGVICAGVFVNLNLGF